MCYCVWYLLITYLLKGNWLCRCQNIPFSPSLKQVLCDCPQATQSWILSLIKLNGNSSCDCAFALVYIVVIYNGLTGLCLLVCVCRVKRLQRGQISVDAVVLILCCWLDQFVVLCTYSSLTVRIQGIWALGLNCFKLIYKTKSKRRSLFILFVYIIILSIRPI